VFLHTVEAFVGLGLDDLDECVVVDVAAEEHLLQLVVDVECIEHLLAQVEVLLELDCELTFFLVSACYPDFVELHCLLECECC